MKTSFKIHVESVQQHFALLGLLVIDSVTGFKGVVTSIGFDLYGCVQAVVSPQVSAEKPIEIPEPRWFDMKRLRSLGSIQVMKLPTFEVVPGPAEKPAMRSAPIR